MRILKKNHWHTDTLFGINNAIFKGITLKPRMEFEIELVLWFEGKDVISNRGVLSFECIQPQSHSLCKMIETRSRGVTHSQCPGFSIFTLGAVVPAGSPFCL